MRTRIFGRIGIFAIALATSCKGGGDDPPSASPHDTASGEHVRTPGSPVPRTPSPAEGDGERDPSHQGSAERDPPDAPAIRERFLEGCSSTCERASAMRAMAWEAIVAGCRESCAGEWGLPLMERGVDLAAHVGRRARVVGTLSKETANADGSSEDASMRLRMIDGTLVALSLLRGKDSAPASGEVVAVGIVEAIRGDAATEPKAPARFRLEAISTIVQIR